MQMLSTKITGIGWMPSQVLISQFHQTRSTNADMICHLMHEEKENGEEKNKTIMITALEKNKM